MQTTAEILISAGMALLAIFFYAIGDFTQTVNPDDPGPGFYPRSLALLLLIAALIQIVQSWRKMRGSRGRGGSAQDSSGFSYPVFAGTLLLSVLYGFFFDKVSYLITTTCFLLAMMMLGGVRRWPVLLGVAVCYSLATYYLFGRVLMVPLK